MDYRAETMQLGTYLIAADGRVAVPTRLAETETIGGRKDMDRACDLLTEPFPRDSLLH